MAVDVDTTYQDNAWLMHVLNVRNRLWHNDWGIIPQGLIRIAGVACPNGYEANQGYYRWARDHGAYYAYDNQISLVEDDAKTSVKPKHQLLWWPEGHIGLLWVREPISNSPGFVAVPPWESICLLTDGGCSPEAQEAALAYLYTTMRNCWREVHPVWSADGGPTAPPLCILPDAMLEDLQQDMQHFFIDSKLYEDLGLPYRRAIILYGDPGNGKTTTASYLALTMPNVYRMVKSVQPSWTSTDMEEIFREASINAPTVLIFEDIDSIKDTQVGRSKFLNILDGIMTEKNHGIYMIATTNYPEQIDPAMLKRPGRFDRVIKIDLPTADVITRYISARFSEKLTVTEQAAIASAGLGLSLSGINELGLQYCWAKLAGETLDIETRAKEIKVQMKEYDKGMMLQPKPDTFGFGSN